MLPGFGERITKEIKDVWKEKEIKVTYQSDRELMAWKSASKLVQLQESSGIIFKKCLT